MRLKQGMLGTFLGDFALSARARLSLMHAAFANPEAVGTDANDYLAGVLVASIVDANKTFLDVGAHIGSVIATVKKNNPATKIIAVEAMPDKVMALRNKFPDIVLHDCAVGDKDGEITFFVNEKLSGYSSLIKPNKTSNPIREIKVKIKKLDSLIGQEVDLDVIKIDVEGAELGVLRGAVNVLNRNKSVVMFESGPTQANSQYTHKEMFTFFSKIDYVIVAPNRLAHNDDGMTEAGFIDSHLYPRHTTNYFAVHKSRRIEIRDRARKVLGISN